MNDGDRPLLRVVKGDPTPDEIAALTVVLLRRGAPAPPVSVRSEWARPGHGERLETGPGAWRRAGRRPGVRTRADW